VVFCAYLNVMLPLPVPLAPEATVIHESSLAAVQVHVLLVDTLIVPPPAAAETLKWFSEIEYEQTIAACVTVSVLPAMVRVPVRAPPTFGATRYRTVPSPVPDAPDVIVIHDALLTADHEQPLLVETFTSPLSPCMGTLSVFREIEYVHEGGGEGGGGEGGGGEGGGGDGGEGGVFAACVTVNVCPAIVIVPARASLEFADTTYPTLPLPVPAPPELTEIHDALLAAVHAQPAVVETLTVPLLPPVGALALVGEIEYEHATGGGDGGGGLGGGVLLAACITVNVRPAIVSVPLRAAPPLTATVNVTVPLPVLVAPDVTVIHSTALAAVHWHVPAAETVTGVPAPPAAAIFWLVGDIVVLHAGGGGGGAGTLIPD
jgi:hypothetical protein